MTGHGVTQPPTGIGRRGFLVGAAGLGLTAAGTTLAGPEAVEAAGAGDLFWLLTSRVDDGSFYPDYDGFRITSNDDDNNNPTNATAQLLSAHAKRMAT